jgi:hypothetical protein
MIHGLETEAINEGSKMRFVKAIPTSGVIAIAAMLSFQPVASKAAVITGGMTDVELTSADVLAGLGLTVSSLGAAAI